MGLRLGGGPFWFRSEPVRFGLHPAHTCGWGRIRGILRPPIWDLPKPSDLPIITGRCV